MISRLLLLLVACHSTQAWWLSDAYEKIMSVTRYSEIPLPDAVLNEPMMNKKGSREVAEVDFAAETLQLRLQNNFLCHDDQLAKMLYARKNRDRPLPLNFWRSLPAQILCQPDESRGVIQSGYIDCRIEITVNGRTFGGKFATFYMVSPDPLTGQFAEKKMQKFAARCDAHLERAQKLNTIEKLKGLKALFESTSSERRLISPFHPACSTFDIQVRVPTFSPFGQETEREVTCKLILVSDLIGEEDCTFSIFSKANPLLMYRLLYDPQYPLPGLRDQHIRSAPLPSPKMTDKDRVGAHVIDARDFLKERNKTNAVWTAVTQTYSEGMEEMMIRKIVPSVIELLEGVKRDDPHVRALDLTCPLAYQTGHQLAPPTTSVFELDLFVRVFTGQTPGLWVIARSQNMLEAAASNYVTTPRESQTLSEFRKWTTNPADRLLWAKYHITNGLKGLFLIIIWDNNLSAYANWYDQMDAKSSLFLSSSQPMAMAKSSRVVVQQLPRNPSSTSPTNSLVVGGDESGGATATGELYPNLNKLQVQEDDRSDAELEAAEQFYRQGLKPKQPSKPEPVVSSLADDFVEIARGQPQVNLPPVDIKDNYAPLQQPQQPESSKPQPNEDQAPLQQQPESSKPQLGPRNSGSAKVPHHQQSSRKVKK